MLRRFGAELLGSALLAAVVVGSGAAAQRLSPSDVGLQLLENALATAAGLYVLVLVLGPVSGAHLNPVVSAVEAALGRMTARELAGYVAAQVAGCVLGTMLADVLYDRPVVALSHHHRASSPHLVAEVVATAGLVLVVLLLARSNRSDAAPAAVAAYVGAAYFFTSSTSFANPAITVGRSLTDTFAGIAPASVPAFVGMQVLGGAVGAALAVVLTREEAPA